MYKVFTVYTLLSDNTHASFKAGEWGWQLTVDARVPWMNFSGRAVLLINLRVNHALALLDLGRWMKAYSLYYSHGTGE